MKNYDVVVIGGGPGGYVAAIRCGQLGLATALVDAWLGADGKPALGGTCLNVGCIPSKALLDSSHHYHNVAHLLPAHGITVEGASMDIATMQSRKDKVVQTMNRGVAALLKKNKVDAFSGHGRLLAENRVAIAIHGGSEEVGPGTPAHVARNTGSAHITGTSPALRPARSPPNRLEQVQPFGRVVDAPRRWNPGLNRVVSA